MNPSLLLSSRSLVRVGCAALAGSMWFGALPVRAADEPATPAPVVRPGAAAANISLRNEVEIAIGRGLAWLEKNQTTNGYWSTPDLPAISALALSSFQMHAATTGQKNPPAAVTKGYAYLASCIQPDGGIYRKDLPSYNTSISLVALVLANRMEYQPAILKARKFIVGLQNEVNGGIGYGTTNKAPDLANTVQALEALVVSKNYLKDKNLPDSADLNWNAAIKFIQSCQNLPGTNQADWVSGDPQNKGGFIYAPGDSKAGSTNLASGKVALRSYGSISYAGMLSYIYADLKTDDPRVSAVLDWLRSNYTLDENPGMGPQGMFYYYHTMTKALSLYGAKELETKDGQRVNWREQLVLKLLNLQKADGSWVSENNRWQEKDPVLVTAYALLTLEMIQGKL